MARILGLDLGTNSIGWAVVDDTKKQIIKTGVRIFPEGVNRDTKGKEVSKNETRRDARQKRRQTFRTKLRKHHLVKALIEHKMYPANATTKKLEEYFKANPYLLRSKALRKELSLFEFGRVLYHLSQRRGFKSNRKAGTSEESVINKGDEKLGKIGIIDTTNSIKEGKFKTLGNYLNSLDTNEQRIRNRYTTRQMYIDEFELIWSKQKQYHSHILTDTLKEQIGNTKNGILFFQRPLRSQKGLVGKCTFEQNKTRCPLSAIPFELFRTYQFINSIEIYSPDGETFQLTNVQRDEIVSLFNKKEKQIEFKEIVQRLGFGKGYKFNYSIDDKHGDKRPGNPTIAQLSKLFENEWGTFSDNEKDLRWHIIYFATDNDWLLNYAKNNWHFSEKQIEKLKKVNLKQDYANLSRKAINNILPFLRKGFTYSAAVILGGIKNAFGEDRFNSLDTNQIDLIENTVLDIFLDKRKKESTIDIIKVFLKQEFKLSDKELRKLYHHSDLDAVNQKLISSALPSPPNVRNPIVQQALFEVQSLVNIIVKEFGALDEIKVELAREMKMPKTVREEIRFKQKEREEENNGAKKILDEYNLRHSRSNIQKYLLWKECKHQCPYTGTEIAIHQLFDEGFVQIEHIIPWSVSLNNSMANKTICLVKENQAKGDRTPFQYYGNDPSKWSEIKSRAYKLLPFRKYQQFVKQEIDTDFVSRQLNDTRYISREAKTYLESICKKVNISSGGVTSDLRHYWGLDTILNPRIKVGNSIPEDDYWAAINTDGTIAETIPWTFNQKEEPTELQKKGRVVLGFARDGYFSITGGPKNRTDHRHHAVDALTIANTKVTFIQELSHWNKQQKMTGRNIFPSPWDNFRNDAENSIKNILVSYKSKNRVTTKIKKKIKKNGKEYTSVGISARGALHEETVYGKRKNMFGEKNDYFNLRKPLPSLTPAMVPKIIDKKIRELAFERLVKRGLKIDRGNNKPIVKTTKEKEIFAKAFDKPLLLPNENGEPIPVKKIRIRVESSNMQPLKDGINQWVEPGKNHHIALYIDSNGNISERVVTQFEAVERKNEGDDIIQRIDTLGNKLLSSLQRNELFLLGFSDETYKEVKNNYEVLSKHLYKVEALSSMYYEFRHHLESNQDNEIRPFYIRIQSFGAGLTGWKNYNPIKVKISPTGKIEPIKE